MFSFEPKDPEARGPGPRLDNSPRSEEAQVHRSTGDTANEGHPQLWHKRRGAINQECRGAIELERGGDVERK